MGGRTLGRRRHQRKRKGSSRTAADHALPIQHCNACHCRCRASAYAAPGRKVSRRQRSYTSVGQLPQDPPELLEQLLLLSR